VMPSPAFWPVPWGTVQLLLLGLIGLTGVLLVVVILVLALGRRRGQSGAPAPPPAAASPPPGGAWLWVRSGPGAGAQYPLSHANTILGSDPSAHVSILHPQVAHRHAAISQERGGFVLRDLGSPSGTFVNGYRITGAVWVRPGDVINLGGAVELVLQIHGR